MFRKWLGFAKGGLAIATVGASALFAAASGSSIASVSTISTVSYKEMKSNGYSDVLSSGVIIAGGTLGILIPPSTAFIIYGMMTEASIGRLLIAGIIPGILLTLLLMITVSAYVRIKSRDIPDLAKYSWKERFVSLRSVIWVAVLFVLVIGGMYWGWFTPTAAAGIGAAGAFVIAMVRRKMNFHILQRCLLETIKTTGFMFAIVTSAFILNYLLNITRIPAMLSNLLANSQLPPLGILLMIVLMYIILGALMDALAMIVITLPLLVPTLLMLDFDLIWFGVIVAILSELALISPPFGMNMFVLKGVWPEIKMTDIYKGALVFAIPIIVMLVLLICYPDIATFLPNRMF
jgi:tripartite ATP-independent transporter DctM subunit